MKIITLKRVGNLLSVTISFSQILLIRATQKLKTDLARNISTLKVTLKEFKLISTGLSTQLTSRWIKHPQAIPRKGKFNNLISIIRLNGLVISCFYTSCISIVLGAWIESLRKRSHVAVLCRQCFAATQSTFVTPCKGKSL